MTNSVNENSLFIRCSWVENSSEDPTFEIISEYGVDNIDLPYEKYVLLIKELDKRLIDSIDVIVGQIIEDIRNDKL